MIEVRFKVTVRLSQWMEDDERCIYLFVKKLEQILKTDTTKETTETEITIWTEYWNNYLELRLTNKFILDVSAPLIFSIFFESTVVREALSTIFFYRNFFTMLV